METTQVYQSGEVIGESSIDLRDAVAQLPQQVSEKIDPITKNSEPVIELAGHRDHPGNFEFTRGEEPGTLVARIRHFSGEHKKEIAIGVVTVGAVLAAFGGVRLRKRRQD